MRQFALVLACVVTLALWAVPASAGLTVLDEESAAVVGTWNGGAGAHSYNGDDKYSMASGTQTATWTFTGLTAGNMYDVLASWRTDTQSWTAAAYTINGGAVMTYDQRFVCPGIYDGPPTGGTNKVIFQYLGSPVAADSGGKITVQTSKDAGGSGSYFFADAAAIRPAEARSVFIIDNGKANTTTTTPFTTNFGNLHSNSGHYFDYAYFDTTSGKTSTWNFTSIPNGKYAIYAAWQASGDRTAAAAYTFLNGSSGSIGNASLNQQTPADDLSGVDGSNWERLGGALYTVSVSDGTLKVNLDSSASGLTLADAIRIQWLEGPTVVPEPAGLLVLGLALVMRRRRA